MDNKDKLDETKSTIADLKTKPVVSKNRLSILGAEPPKSESKPTTSETKSTDAKIKSDDEEKSVAVEIDKPAGSKADKTTEPQNKSSTKLKRFFKKFKLKKPEDKEKVRLGLRHIF